MEKLNKELYSILRGQELTGWDSKPILDAMSPYYKNGNEEVKALIIKKVESLKVEPGVEFPTNYEQILKS
ncbi:hypothetical protein [Serratia sp. 14-2641]|uniref:hypothetical protein n=1 Tax=Serratia sp. 14-2641 TaxID=1841657 RepID=UPI00080FC3B2|nr:hypothetical protein [Serratia sp. 14-2641]OCJ22627.1 hypothetical protein A6U95_12600 [Serratia sp. 14-2641]